MFRFLTIKVSQNCSYCEDNYYTQLHDDDREVCLSCVILNPTVLNPVLILPAVIPFIEFFNPTFQLVSTKWNSAVITIIANLESVSHIRILINLEDDLGCKDRVAQNTVLTVSCSIEIILVDAICIC